jgi:eukaryotic translation initiation factor 2C
MLGMGVPRDEPAMLKGNPHGDITQIIGEIIAKSKSKFGNKPDLVMVLVHGASDRLYRAIKNVCEITFGVASQGRMAFF